MHLVPFLPGAEMIHGGQVIGLRIVTAGMRQPAVETLSALDIAQDRPIKLQAPSLPPDELFGGTGYGNGVSKMF
jgi:hypothetical protein